MYLLTHVVVFRATQFVRSKARFAGNVGDLSKNRNAAADELGGSEYYNMSDEVHL